MKKTKNIEHNEPGFSNELYKPSVQPGAKERTILMLLKDHEYAIRRMDHYYQENLIATTEDLYNLNGDDRGKSIIAEDDEYIVDPDGVTRKLKPGEKNTIFLESENNDIPFIPRSRVKIDNQMTATTDTKITENTIEEPQGSYLNLLAAEKKKKSQSSLSKKEIPLAPEGNYEENCYYFNEPKIVPKDQKIKVVFPEDEKDKEEEHLGYLQTYIRNKRIAIKGDYMKDYKKYQVTLQDEMQPHPSGINIYEGAKTFLSQSQIKEIQRLQQDQSLIPNKANLDKSREKAKAKIKFKLPNSIESFDANKPKYNDKSEDEKGKDSSTNTHDSNGENKSNDTPSNKFDIKSVIENAQIRKNNFSLLYTEQDKEFGRKLDKWKKYKYIQGQGKEKGKLLRYSIWRKDIFVQDRRNEDENKGIDEKGCNDINKSLMDVQIKKYLLKNNNTTEQEKEEIKNNHINSLLKWEEERKQDLVKKLKKESQSLHAYLSRIHSHMNPDFTDLNYPIDDNTKDSSSTTKDTTSSLKNDGNSSKSDLTQNNSSTFNSIMALNNANNFTSLNNLLNKASLAIENNCKVDKSNKGRYDNAKFNALMRKSKQENKISYLRDYCKQKKKLSQQDNQYPKDIFNDNKSLMDHINNFSVDKFIHEYKAYVKHKESIWNRENNHNDNDHDNQYNCYNGITLNVGIDALHRDSRESSLASSISNINNYRDTNRRKSVNQILKERSLDIIRDLVDNTVNSKEHYIRFKFKSNYSGNPSPEYIHEMIHILMHHAGEWTDKELVEVRTFIGSLKSFKGNSKDFITNILYNSKVNYYDKNTTIYIIGTVIIRYINTKDLYSHSLLTSTHSPNTLSTSSSNHNYLEVPKLYGNGYYNRRKSYFEPNLNEQKINKAMGLCRRGSHNDKSTKNEEIQILNIGECFSNFEKNDNGFELDSILTSSPAYILEIEKSDYEKYKKLIEEHDKKEKSRFLKTLPLFSNFSYDSLYSFAEIINYRNVPVGHTILNFGQPLEEFYIVKRGKCNVYRKLYLEKDGEVKAFKIYVGQYGPGEYFGERGIIEYHGFLNIKNLNLLSKFIEHPLQDKVPILSELMVVATEDKHEPSIYDEDKDNNLESLLDSNSMNNEEKKAHQRKLKESKVIELAVISLNKARLKIKNLIEYTKFEKLTQDELYCLYLESDQEKKWNKLKRQFNDDRLKEIYHDPNITESSLDEMKSKERWKI